MSKRSSIVTGISAALVLFLAAGSIYLRGGSTPVPLTDAVERYRSATPLPQAATKQERSTAQRERERPTTESETVDPTSDEPIADPARPLPPEGVYAYATEGHDEVDILGGNRHTYPDETTITVRQAGCGTIERWDALDERWDERESCHEEGGDTLARVTSYHEFFRHGDERTLVCDGYTYPSGAQPGDSWTTTCETPNTKAVTALRAVEFEGVEVGGRTVRTLHVRADTVLSGEQKGESHRDVWGSSENGIVLKETAMIESESVQPGFGTVTYTESYEIRLKSLQPKT